MFLGEYTHSIDEKGRLTVPARFRGDLAAGLVVTCGFDKNLVVYPMAEWMKLAEKIAAQPYASERARELRRLLFSQAVDLTPDRQGRILLPQNLREYAGIDGEAVVAGMFNYVEIWSVAEWQSVREGIQDNTAAERWKELGI